MASVHLIQPGATLAKSLSGAFGPGDLKPVSYNWRVALNPYGRIPETDRTNNTISATVTVVP